MSRRFTGEGRYWPAPSATWISVKNISTPRCSIACLRLSQPRRHCCALASMLPTERHFCRSGRTMHGTAVSYSAWRTHIACVGVVVLFHGGCWSFLTCPRTYLLTSSIKAGPLPSSALSCTPSSVLRTLGLPPGSARFQPSGLILAVLVRLDCPVGSLLFRIVLSQRATA